ncbi:MAG: EscU/YscU/HrcU family type III secretion system export apparatus switch protein [Tagaea sp.]|nr:EscU/YscU/HrcU family type III secretion system export apparatus switch protein [Azospirillum sp.]MCA3266233.1 EscU/YscU/HrcU family type III secretion system export apparatus switch protein [Azospirillum sp.]MCZ8122290.1 EscU/YscU/HrcU family type III secretion system export apparatus switch protein [Magnetospirillum sp.]
MARRPPRKPFDPDVTRAVALKYERGGDEAPIVKAKGEGLLADKIVEIARAHGVEVRSDRDLVRLLDAVDVDSPIPLEAFQAVAEILSYIYRKQDKLKPTADAKGR